MMNAKPAVIAALFLLMCGCMQLPRSRSGGIALVRRGEPTATIVVADDPVAIPVRPHGGREHLTVHYAAEELQTFIESATGARLPLATASEAPADGTLVLVGTSALTEAFGLEAPRAEEGLRIVTFPRGIAILGEVAGTGVDNLHHPMDRGTLFGVYEFLEQVVGFRFFSHRQENPDLGIVTPRLRDLVVPADYRLEMAPDFPYRSAGFPTWGHPLEWMRVTRERVGSGFTGANHTDEMWGRAYRADHPEWFALGKDGTRSDTYLCYSEPAVLEERLRLIADYYDPDKPNRWHGHTPPTESYIAFVPADVFSWNGRCYCERCDAIYHEERGRFGKFSHTIFQHGKQLAEAVSTRWPDKRVSMLAYEGYMLPPDFDLPDNLDVQVCMMWSTTMGKEPYWHERNLDLIRTWHEKLGGGDGRIYIWNYYCWPAFWTSAPLFFPNNLQQWLKDTHGTSGGEFINPGGNPPQFEMLMCRIWHRLMWDRHLDVDAEITDHAHTFFGPAGALMDSFYKTIIDRYENVMWSQRFEESYVPPEQMYNETYTPDTIARLRELMDRAEATTPDDSIYRARMLWMREGFEPFFEEATLAHKWLNTQPAYAVPTRDQPPTDDAGWHDEPGVALVEGNYGRSADLTTEVRLILADTGYLRFDAAEPERVLDGDRLELLIRVGEDRFALGLSGKGEIDGDIAAEIVSNRHADGVWSVVLRISDPGPLMGATDETRDAQFSRIRVNDRQRGPGHDYFWMPPMKPPWGEPFRFGQLHMPDWKR